MSWSFYLCTSLMWKVVARSRFCRRARYVHYHLVTYGILCIYSNTLLTLLIILGHLYCEDCYGKYLAPDCEKCRKKILGVSKKWLRYISISIILFNRGAVQFITLYLIIILEQKAIISLRCKKNPSSINT